MLTPFISRLAPPSVDPYANLGLAVLHLSAKELAVTAGLIQWAMTDDAEFWCRVARINYQEFIKNARAYQYSVTS